MADTLYVELVRDEIVTTRPTITFDVPEEADEALVPRVVGVLGVDGQARATRGPGRFRWSPDTELPPGRHTFVVEPLTDPTGRRVVAEAIEVPFTVVDTQAKIPDRWRVESFTRVRLGDEDSERLPVDRRPRGKYLDFVKAVDRRSGKPIRAAFDQDGDRVDGDSLLEEHQARLARRRGKVDPSLAATLKAAKRGQPVMVDVWFDLGDDEPGAVDRPMHDRDIESAMRQAEELRQTRRERIEELAQRLGDDAEIVTVDHSAPLATLRLPAAAVDDMAARDEVAGVFLHETEGIDDLDDSIAVARSDIVHSWGITGAGVRVAVWEDGPTSNADLVIAGRFETNPTTTNHSQNVHGIIRNNEDDTPNGHAPGCSLYSANDYGRPALTWAVEDQECTVVNQSFHRSSEPGSGSLSSDDLYKDWLALHWPYPLIVHAAGNFWNGDSDNINPPSSEYVNHKGYNTISVGNHNDTAGAMSGSSVFRNPTSPHGDRELPEIAANGTVVEAAGITKSGTSMASPAVAGIAALMQEKAPTLKHWPEGCRAILLSSAARNVRDGTWWQDVSGGVDARDGAGAVDAAEAVRVAGNRRWRNAPGTQRGWDIGRLGSGDFGDDAQSSFSYNVTVPKWIWGPRNVKVALAWTSQVSKIFGVFHTSNLTVDLDLRVFDDNGIQVGYSGSWDNSYEIAEFVGKPGKTYTIKIRRWSGDDSTWYGIGWTVTGGLFFPIPFDELTIARAVARQ